MAINLRPLGDRIVVQRSDESEEKRGSIYIPDTAKEKPQRGEVVAVGNGRLGDDGKRTALEIKVGDKILFGKYVGNDVKFDDEEYLIMREDDVLAVIEG